MAKPSPWWQQIVKQIPPSLLVQLHRRFGRLLGKRFNSPASWLLNLTIIVAMLLWNWKLVLATGVGIFVMLLVYLMRDWDWQVHLSYLNRLLNGANKHLVLAVGSGGIAAVSTYMTACVWVESDSPWMAAGAILQGFGTLATLILLVWQIISRQTNRQETRINQLLVNLTAVEPLKRLIAVRQLSAIATSRSIDVGNSKAIADYFRVMLAQEQEPVIREAVLDGLQTLDDAQILKKVAIPLNLTKKQPVTTTHSYNSQQ